MSGRLLLIGSIPSVRKSSKIQNLARPYLLQVRKTAIKYCIDNELYIVISNKVSAFHAEDNVFDHVAQFLSAIIIVAQRPIFRTMLVLARSITEQVVHYPQNYKTIHF